MSNPTAIAGGVVVWAAVLVSGLSADDSADGGLWEAVERGHADSAGVPIHYATLGSGPLLVMIHGFPDFWYSWRHQMPELAKTHRVVAVDLRGYNRSGKPGADEDYAMPRLVSDIVAVIDHFGEARAVVAGHDWGGAVAWSVTMAHPERVRGLIICNLPHPAGFARELARNPEQQANSQYARDFQKPDAHRALSPEAMAPWGGGESEVVRNRYVEAFRRSDIEAMLRYYRVNYPREPYLVPPDDAFPPVSCPVLMIHGLEDPYLLAAGLNDTWRWVRSDLTITTVPGAGHWVHHDAAERVTRWMADWLGRLESEE